MITSHVDHLGCCTVNKTICHFHDNDRAVIVRCDKGGFWHCFFGKHVASYGCGSGIMVHIEWTRKGHIVDQVHQGACFYQEVFG